MDPEWVGPGWYRPADGDHHSKASGKTEWIPCDVGDQHGRDFWSYEEFKEHKRKLRLKDRLDAYKIHK